MVYAARAGDRTRILGGPAGPDLFRWNERTLSIFWAKPYSSGSPQGRCFSGGSATSGWRPCGAFLGGTVTTCEIIGDCRGCRPPSLNILRPGPLVCMLSKGLGALGGAGKTTGLVGKAPRKAFGGTGGHGGVSVLAGAKYLVARHKGKKTNKGKNGGGGQKNWPPHGFGIEEKGGPWGSFGGGPGAHGPKGGGMWGRRIGGGHRNLPGPHFTAVSFFSWGGGGAGRRGRFFFPGRRGQTRPLVTSNQPGGSGLCAGGGPRFCGKAPGSGGGKNLEKKKKRGGGGNGGPGFTRLHGGGVFSGSLGEGN